MIESYPLVKAVHIGAVVASGLVFALRGLLVLSGRQPLALAPLVRRLSHAIDTLLLTAALLLVAMLPAAAFSNGWLAAKLGLLVPYIVLGTFALRRGRSARTRGICYAAAIGTYLVIFSIARMHHPGGVFWLLAT